MKTVPENFIEYEGDEILSNYDHEINQQTANAIKGKELFSRYAGWNFNGKVWWDTDEEKWYCAILCYGRHSETVVKDELSEIMKDVCSKYGND